METSATTQTPARAAPLTLSFILIGVIALVVALFAAESLYNGWYALFKAVHVIFAVIWIGGGFVLTLLGLIAEQRNDPGEIAIVARQAATVGLKVFAPAGLIVFLMGIAMMLNTNWGWGKFWVVAGLVGYAMTFLTGLLVLDPLTKKIDASVHANGPTHPETIVLVKRVLFIVRFDMALLFLVVADMVTKPFA